MYRDSDGYILIDMGAADISKSTQSIVGFYDRIVESVSANKLVLVINFGTYSPMPAIAHKKLNYYEIVTNLYKITINSNDIVIIEETGESTVDVSIVPTLQSGVKVADFAIGEVEGSIYAPEQVDVINDNVTASNTTWSSDKIDDELDLKADSSSLAAVATSGSYADLTNKPTIPADLDDLSDVTLTSPADGQTLVYDSTSEHFVNATPPSGVTTLAALTDVSLTTPASGNALVYDGSDWTNNTLDADAIPYSAGVSVADMLDIEDLSSQVTLRSGYDIASWGNLKLIKYGHLCHLSFSGVGTSSTITADTPIFDLPVTAKYYSTGSAFQRSSLVNRNFNILIDANATQIKCNSFEPSSYAYGCITFFV